MKPLIVGLLAGALGGVTGAWLARRKPTQGGPDRAALLRADVGAALTHTGTLPEILQSCTEAMVRHLGAAFARIWVLPPGTQVLELRASAGRYTHLELAERASRLHQGMVRGMGMGSKPVQCQDRWAFCFLLAFLASIYISPGEWIPGLAKWRPALLLSALSTGRMLLGRMGRREPLRVDGQRVPSSWFSVDWSSRR